MLVYWDANALASRHATGIVVYGAQLLRELQKYPDLEFRGLLKLSRLKRRHFLPLHARLRTQLYVPPVSDWFLKRDAVYHGIDFKIPVTRRLPRVVTIHDLGVFENELSDPRFQSDGIAYITYLIRKLKPERIIVPTEFGRAYLLQHFPETREIIRVILHGSEQAAALTPDDAWLSSLALKRPFILCPGSVEKRKNGRRLIEAFEKSRSGKDLSLVFAGGRGYASEEIVARAAASRLSKQIHFYSGISSAQLTALYKDSLFTIYPSVFEGFGLPIVEAFSLRSPLITSNIGAMAEVAGKAALTVDPYSVEALSDAIDAMASSEVLRREYQARGTARAKDFSWKKAAAETRDVYRELQS